MDDPSPSDPIAIDGPPADAPELPPFEVPLPLWVDPVRGAWTLVKMRPRLWAWLVTPAVVSQAIYAVSAQLKSGPPPESAASGLLAVAELVGGVASLVGLVAGLAMVVAMASEALGHPVDSASQAIGRVGGRALELIGLGCVVGIPFFAFVIGLSILTGQFTVAQQSAAPSEPYSVWFQLLWVILIPAFGWVAFASQYILLTHGSLGGSMSLASRLVAHGWRRALPVWLLAQLPTILVYPLAYLVAPASYLTLSAWILVGLAAFWTPVYTALMLLVWYRCRAEQYGLTIEAAVAELLYDPGLGSANRRAATVPVDVQSSVAARPEIPRDELPEPLVTEAPLRNRRRPKR